MYTIDEHDQRVCCSRPHVFHSSTVYSAQTIHTLHQYCRDILLSIFFSKTFFFILIFSRFARASDIPLCIICVCMCIMHIMCACALCIICAVSATCLDTTRNAFYLFFYFFMSTRTRKIKTKGFALNE